MMLVLLVLGLGCGDDEPDMGGMNADGGTRPPTMNADGGTSTMPPPTGDTVPDIAHCENARESNWQSQWTTFEGEVLRLVNEARARGYNCDSEGNFGPTHPLQMQAQLRCAARLHSRDMSVRDYFDHIDPEGGNPGDRIQPTGYAFRGWGENIAAGQPTPESVVEAWLESDGHCSNIMSPNFTEIGVGYYERYWTQVFGTPR